MRILFLSLIIAFFLNTSFAQSVPGPTQKILTDSICNCLSLVNIDNITNKKEAIAAFTECFAKRTDLLMKVAEERNIDFTDQEEMKKIGIDIGKDLFKQNCAAFTKLSIKMVENDKENAGKGISIGKIKRIDLKGFNYMVIADQDNSEKSFLWLRQFPGSENFTNGIVKYTNKEVKIKWQEMEVYLPQAKGYYKIKEITSIEIL